MSKDKQENQKDPQTRLSMEDYFKEQAALGNVSDALPEFYEFKEKDQFLVGLYQGFRDVTSSTTKGEFHIHAIETDKGIVEFIGGKQIDRVLDDPGMIGKLVQITFKGIEQLSGNRNLKKFTVFFTEPPKTV